MLTWCEYAWGLANDQAHYTDNIFCPGNYEDIYMKARRSWVLPPTTRICDAQGSDYTALQWRFMNVVAPQITAHSTVCSITCWHQHHQSSKTLALYKGNPLVTGSFPSQRSTNAESIPMSWRHHIIRIDLIHKSQNVPVPYPTMLYSEQKCEHFCSEWSIVGYGTNASWDLSIAHNERTIRDTELNGTTCINAGLECHHRLKPGVTYAWSLPIWSMVSYGVEPGTLISSVIMSQIRWYHPDSHDTWPGTLISWGQIWYWTL